MVPLVPPIDSSHISVCVCSACEAIHLGISFLSWALVMLPIKGRESVNTDI